MENVSQRCNIGFTLAIVQTVQPPVRRLSRGCCCIRRCAVGLCGFRDVCADNTLKSSSEGIVEDCQRCRNIHLCTEQVLLWPAGHRQLNQQRCVSPVHWCWPLPASVLALHVLAAIQPSSHNVTLLKLTFYMMATQCGCVIKLARTEMKQAGTECTASSLSLSFCPTATTLNQFVSIPNEQQRC